MAKQAPLETEEELGFIKEYILLPIILDVLERDIKSMQSLPLKMPAIYIAILRKVQDQISVDLGVLRKKMRLCGIKVYDQRRTSLSAEADYLCRGYRHTFSMLWSVVKAEVEKRLRRYLCIGFANEG